MDLTLTLTLALALALALTLALALPLTLTKVFEEALMVAKSDSRPVCLLAPPKTFSGTKAVAPIVSGASQPTREAAIEVVLSQVCLEPSP